MSAGLIMIHSEVFIYIVRLVLGGIAAFLSIIVWNRTRDTAWMSLTAAAVTGYAGLVFELLVKLGIADTSGFLVFGVPADILVFTVVPSCFFITAFIIVLLRK